LAWPPARWLCWASWTPDPGFRWLYYLALLVNAELVFAQPGWPALGKARFVPAWLRS